MKCILLDFGGTLDCNGIAWKERFYPLYKTCGVDVPAERFDRAFYDSDDNLHLNHNLKACGFEETVKLQIEDVFSNLGIKNPTAQKAVADKFIAESRHYFGLNKPVLKQLKKDYKLGIVSNFYGNISGVLKSEGLLDFFDAVADSNAIGHIKPSAEIFMYALDKISASPKDAIMVGDSVKRDMAGGDNLGMLCALLWGDRFEHELPPSNFAKRHIVLKNFSELPSKLAEALAGVK